MSEDKVASVKPARLVVGGQLPIAHRNAILALLTAEAQTPEEAADTRTLEAKFAELEDREVYMMANDEDEPIAPRIGVENVPESTLRLWAEFEWIDRERKRTDRRDQKSQEVMIAIAAVGWVLAVIGLLLYVV